MSFQSKGFWMSKDAGFLIDGDITYDNVSKIEPKRPHQWLIDGGETELFPNKKKTIEVPSNNSLGISSSTLSPWENTPIFHSLTNQFSERFFDIDRNIASINATNYGGLTKVKVSEVREDNVVIPLTHSYGKVDDSCISMGLTYGQEEDAIITIDDNFVSLDQSFNKDDVDEISMGCNYKANSNTVLLTNSFGDGVNILSMAKNRTGGESLVSMGNNNNIISMGTLSKGDYHIVSMNESYDGGESLVSMSNNYGKGVRNIISFSGCDDDDVSGRLVSSVDFVMSQTPIPKANTLKHKDVVISDKKDDSKSKISNFPSNVRSLLSTGILDEVPVKYIAWSREKELRGVIKGSGYLCGCRSCNFSKVISAYELEQHAGCKSKHPNKHIYFGNGKTIYGIVQELRSTPQNTLFDVIQTITGSPINQKFFRIWKESFLAATRELQRIYGKD